jgi:hypothetical protein
LRMLALPKKTHDLVSPKRHDEYSGVAKTLCAGATLEQHAQKLLELTRQTNELLRVKQLPAQTVDATPT